MRKLGVARETISRQKAQEWLLCVNEDVQRNRAVADVKRYARVMDAGAWKPWTQMIAFDRKGTLINGQHVLAAFLESKMKYLSVTVSRNHETGDYAGFDKNRKRSAVDDLRYEGVERAGQIKPVATVIWQFERGLFAGMRYLTVRGGAEFPAPSEIVEVVKTHPGIEQHLLKNPVRSGGGSYSLGALRAASWILHQYHPDTAPKFFHSLMERVGIPSKDHPINRLWEELFNMRKGEKLNAGETLARIFKAWTLYMQQLAARASLLKKNEQFPDIYAPEAMHTKAQNVM